METLGSSKKAANPQAWNLGLWVQGLGFRVQGGFSKHTTEGFTLRPKERSSVRLARGLDQAVSESPAQAAGELWMHI